MSERGGSGDSHRASKMTPNRHIAHWPEIPNQNDPLKLRPARVTKIKRPKVLVLVVKNTISGSPVIWLPSRGTVVEAKTLQRVVGSLLYYGIIERLITASSPLSLRVLLPASPPHGQDHGWHAAAPGLCRSVPRRLPRLPPLLHHTSQSPFQWFSSFPPQLPQCRWRFHFLGTSDPSFLNPPIHCFSSQIPVVTAAVSETEYAAAFAKSRAAVSEREALNNLG